MEDQTPVVRLQQATQRGGAQLLSLPLMGSIASVELKLMLGNQGVTEEFIVCRQLRRNIILGVDFGKKDN